MGKARKQTDLKPVFIRRAEVMTMTGLTSSVLYAEMGEGRFPKPYQLTRNSVGWKLVEVEDWIDARPLAERNGPKAA